MQHKETHDGNTAEVTLQFIPIVAIIDSQNLVLCKDIYQQLMRTAKIKATHMHAEEMLHSLKNGDNRVLDDRNYIWRGVRYVRSDGFICGCPEVIFVTWSVYE